MPDQSPEEIAEQQRRDEHRDTLARLRARKPGSKGYRAPKPKRETMNTLTLTQNEYIQLPSGLIVADHIAEDYFEQWRRPVAIDLFCGAGGFSCGITQAGFDVIAAADNNTSATMTYLVNLGAHPCKIHFVTPADERRLEKAGRERACVSGSDGSATSRIL